MNKDNLRPVTSIKHDDKRAAIPDSKITVTMFAVANGMRY